MISEGKKEDIGAWSRSRARTVLMPEDVPMVSSTRDEVDKLSNTPPTIAKLLNKPERLKASEVKAAIDEDPTLTFVGFGAESIVIDNPNKNLRLWRMSTTQIQN